MNKTVVIFNGPPGCGKDVCVEEMIKHFGGEHREMKDQLIKIAILVSGVSERDWVERYENRETKEIPWGKLGGFSQRQFLIHISEKFIKPIFGPSYFGKIAANKINSELTFFSDGGFIDEILELKPVCDKLILIRIHREFFTFDNDSRDYIYPNDKEIIEIDINNNKDLISMFNCIKAELQGLIG